MNKLGIDIGRVIISTSSGKSDTSFLKGSIIEAMKTLPYEGAFDTITKLNKLFNNQVWVISKAFPKTEEKSRAWLDHHKFFETTGVPQNNLIFVNHRPEKAVHCKSLGITHFIDDRQDVLSHMKGITPYLFLFGPQKHPVTETGLIEAGSWATLFELITKTL